MLLDRIFNLLIDNGINKVPASSFAEILTSIRGQNLGWRFFVESINQINDVNSPTNDLFFIKALSIVQGYLRDTSVLDTNLIQLLVKELLLPNFENKSTLVRKQVVLSLAELRFIMEVRLQTQASLCETSYELITHGLLNAGRQKLV